MQRVSSWPGVAPHLPAPTARPLPPGRSNNNIYAQVIDDSKGHVLASASSKMKDTEINGANVAGAMEVGKLVAEKCKAIGITKVHFDRNGRVYHGRVKAVAEGAREGGLDF